MKIKKCIRCLKELSLSNFYKDKSRLSGYKEVCKFCKKEEVNQTHIIYPERRVLSSIKARCYNPKNKDYKTYGAKGIKCEITVEEIKQLMFRDNYSSLKEPTIDRINHNGNYIFDNCRFIENIKNISLAHSKPILQLNLIGTIIAEYPSMTIASNKTKINYSNIRSCAQRKQKTAGGYRWYYKS